MEFQQDLPKDKKITARSFNFLPENLEKLHSTELYAAALEGSTFFLRRSSLDSTAMESCGLLELKYGMLRRPSRRFYRKP